MGSGQGPANIILSQNKIVLDGKEFPVFQVGKGKCSRRVLVADDVKIPGLTEALVDVYIEREESDDCLMVAEYIVEPSSNFKDKYQLVMASTLVDINKLSTCKGRVLNPIDVVVTLRQNTDVGRAELIERIVSVIAEEEPEKVKQKHGKLRKVSEVSSTQTKLHQFMDQPIPEHLKELYEQGYCQAIWSSTGFTIVRNSTIVRIFFGGFVVIASRIFDIGTK
ncbi:hypothetical protein DPMN_042514 [Dreissena polymorpha]|uniref:Uncharacterized protein n=1 Tax=Dreissena polymorpha TaxID=45954 RepID=A0A9D4HX40_DREPO|nr:hypothetical protein DPMN_042514 [Dreissena polymorpha]